MNNLKEWLIGNEFKIYEDCYGDKNNQCRWYACRKTNAVKDCGCNNRPPQIFVYPYSATFNNGQHYESITVELIGEDFGIWWNFSAYSLSTKELMENLGMIEDRLVKAWEDKK